MAGEGQRQTYLEETYKTVLSPRTLLVETTDCDDYGWNVRLNKNCCVLRKALIFPVPLSVFSLVPDLSLYCSIVVEYPKIRTVLRSIYPDEIVS